MALARPTFIVMAVLFVLLLLFINANADLRVSGWLDKQLIQNFTNSKPIPITFNEGQELSYGCVAWFKKPNSDIGLHWIHQKNNVTLFYGGLTTFPSIKMKLYRFDNGSTLSCVAVDRISKKTARITIPLYLRESSTLPHPEYYQEKSVEVGDTFAMSCKNYSHLFSASPDYSKVNIDQKHTFDVVEDNNRMILYCVDYKKDLDTLSTERFISNIAILQIKIEKTDEHNFLFGWLIAGVVIAGLGIAAFMVWSFMRCRDTPGESNAKHLRLTNDSQESGEAEQHDMQLVKNDPDAIYEEPYVVFQNDPRYTERMVPNRERNGNVRPALDFNGLRREA